MIVKRIKKEAIILKNIDYKESSKLVYVYSKDGNESFLASGVKKLKNSTKTLIEPITCVEYESTNKNFSILKEIDLLYNFDDIKYNLEKQVYAMHILEIIYTLSIEVDHTKIYLMLKKVLINLSILDNTEEISFAFELKMLHFLGFGLNNLPLNMNQDIKEIIKYLYLVKFDNLKDYIITNSIKREIRFFIDIQYQNNLSYKTKTRKLIHDIFKY